MMSTKPRATSTAPSPVDESGDRRQGGQGVTRERLIVLGRAPEHDIAGVTFDALAVLVVDPQVEAHWDAALQAVTEHGARVRLRWRGAKALAAIGRRADLAALLPAFEGWVAAKRNGGGDEDSHDQAPEFENSWRGQRCGPRRRRRRMMERRTIGGGPG